MIKKQTVYFALLLLELTGGDGEKKEGANEEEDPEVNQTYLSLYTTSCALFVIINSIIMIVKGYL